MRATTCVARYAQRQGTRIVVVPIAPWQGLVCTRRGTIQVRRKREGSEAGAVSVTKSSVIENIFGVIISSNPEAGALCKDKFSNVEKKKGVYIFFRPLWELSSV